ncbi:MAG: Crossover junction endodeoxyribonuclease RuvC [candidate division WS6 bacterium GW2011_GWC1_36_11]|uniref:Crossover junction endodeoxyribonuclease RuvC n=2 Tax=Candidatus Dojkabacteria TaxID=74243 RepID=A0A0G0DEH7_9BACT|nr:MAG: Crossover junction endodeoxyribonuclease RuvC [candidate division WS6 bacterium GW2011_GWC1_36_11]KKQ04391.1 MAG: Crossover junction endodeoxyribonuclease RuvC [candidate division WS6 bacterium GW2011_WS6_36_26]KKQ10867.1 MAG: Crossover junction endodeoxyribonuclease RuvC [candidate division WS6 bacterium GW2011_GWC2_36_7]HAM96888.1 crossover junction endodeoxyribonuclease RuvC [Patescibacteria group bacterium]
MRILGIDPGVATTGWAIIDFDKDNKPHPVDYGAILTAKTLTISQRLEEIYKDLNELIVKFKPEYAGVETLLFCNNAKTAITVGEARGVVLLTLQQHNIPLKEFTPLQVKDAITGYGKADKRQVQENVKTICELDEIPKPDDAADALAIAIATEILVSRKQY